LREGMVAGLASLSKEGKQQIFASPVTLIFYYSDFAGYPQLCEEWVTYSAASGQMSPVDALVEIVRIRQEDGKRQPVDEGLLSQLWPQRSWTPGEATELIGKLPQAALASDVIQHRFTALLDEAMAQPGYGEWAPFLAMMSRLPGGNLPNWQLALARELSTVMPLIEAASRPYPGATYMPSSRATEAMTKLVGRYDDSSGRLREFFNQRLPRLLMFHVLPGMVLAWCPESLLAEFCTQAHAWLADNRQDIEVAARLYVGVRALRMHDYRHRASDLEQELLLPLLDFWEYSKFDRAAAEADKIYLNGGKYLKLWVKQNRSRRFPFTFSMLRRER
jgi:GTPase-associated protein 1, C-terminal domain